MNSEDSSGIVWSVSDFVAAINQALDYAFPFQEVVGEVANLKISRNRWVYFDLKDELASLRCFGSVFSLNTVIDDGMQVKISGAPSLHPQFGFSLNFQTIRPTGEGSIKKASKLLEEKLKREGLFDESRKRQLPYPPKSIGLIGSIESAAYHDFMKVLNSRWCGVNINVFDVKVQGDDSAGEIIKAINYFNTVSDCEVLVITRGGGSKDDLIAFDSENLVRAVAVSRIPTLVAIGHEVDISLSELAADKRASTPSNAAELLVPDRQQTLDLLSEQKTRVRDIANGRVVGEQMWLESAKREALGLLVSELNNSTKVLAHDHRLLESLHPNAVLKRGYAIVRSGKRSVASVSELNLGGNIEVNFKDGLAEAEIRHLEVK